METLLTQLEKHCKLEDIKCAFLHLAYGYNFANIDSRFSDLEPIVISKHLKLFLPERRNSVCNLENFCNELNWVTAELSKDIHWDCGGNVWLKDGDWLMLKATKNLAYFERNYAPLIPDELINPID